MGRKESHYLKALAHDSMEQQSTKVRPGLLKRNSLDSVDFLRQQSERRSKSQQVRFKDDGTNRKHTVLNGLEAKPVNDTSLVIGKALMPTLHNLPNCSISFPRSKRALRNIAIQTSPSLRKHFPIFRKKIVMTSKSLKEVSLESKGSFQVNGNLYEQDSMSSELSHLRIAKHFDDTSKPSKKACKLKRRIPKAHNNGPVNICSEVSTFLTLEKTTVSMQSPDCTHQGLAQKSEDSICALERPMDVYSVHPSVHIKGSSTKDLCVCNASQSSRTNWQCDFCETTKNGTETSLPNDNSGIKRTNTSSCLSHKGSLPHFHKGHTRPAQSITQPDHRTLNGDNPALMPFADSDKHEKSVQTPKSAPICQTDTENGSSAPSERSHSQTFEGGFTNKSCVPRNKSNLQTRSEIREVNQIHLAPGELGALQTKLRAIEQSLDSNQEKIKVLLNVIQDLEKARAFSEGEKTTTIRTLNYTYGDEACFFKRDVSYRLS